MNNPETQNNSFFVRYRIFQKVVALTFIVFFSMLGMAVVVAYGRTSGNTGLDMAKMQQLRSGQEK